VRLQGPVLATVLLIAVLAGGTSGYVLIERWSVWDALNMTVTTVTTVGFREVHPLSRAGEVFTLVNPSPEAVMHADDQLVVLGPAPSLKELEGAARAS